MNRTESPYHPGFGQRPDFLAGREPILRAGDELIETAAAAGRMPSPLILVGPRGVGKTVLLGEIARRAGEARGWPRLRVEAVKGEPLIPLLLDGVREVLHSLPAHRPSRSMQVDQVVARAGLGPVGAELHLNRVSDPAPTAQAELMVAFRQLAETLDASETGAVITVDETHNVPNVQLNALAAVLQAGAEFGWPFAVVLAGLPSMRDATRFVTYLERGDWHTVGFLDRMQTLEALVEPALTRGKRMDAAAAQLLAERSGGYPYAVQLMGNAAWLRAAPDAAITLSDAEAAAGDAERKLHDGFYANRWQQASKREKQYLLAIAHDMEDGVQPTGGSVARRLNGTTPQWSAARSALIDKGTIYVEGGVIRFAIPGFQRFVLQQADDLVSGGS